MKMVVTLASALVLALTGCKPAPQQPAAPAQAQVSAPAATGPVEGLLLGAFAGDLPCADCPGMATRLTLVMKDHGWAEGRYLMVQTYRERAAPPLIRTGEWTTLRGDADNPDATVYQLDPDKPSGGPAFRKEGDNTLRALTQSMRPLPDGLPQTLTRDTTDLPDAKGIDCLRGGGIPGSDGTCVKI